MSYTDVFGGANIYPSEINYSALTVTADVVLSWPEETSAATYFATRIMDLSSSVDGWVVRMPDGSKAGTGATVLFNNVGSASIIVSKSTGVQIVSLAAGEQWQVYLTDNTTAAGTWRALQYGAAVSNANASALAGTGIVAVGTQLSQSVPVTTFNSDYAAAATDRAKMFVWTGAAGNFTIAAASVLGDNWFTYLRNSGTGAVTVAPDGSPIIDGAATLLVEPGESAIIATDGSNFYTIGYGQSATFAFDYTVIDVAGTGSYTLAGTELNRIAYNFTGILTGSRNVIVPNTVQQYWISNVTTGAFDFTVKTLAGTGITLASGQRAIFYCDGTDVVDADSSTVSTPIAVAQGGTGSTTASGARINLGGTSVGIALFTAADVTAAWTALGNSPLITGGTF
jgi:hypothetical protein